MGMTSSLPFYPNITELNRAMTIRLSRKYRTDGFTLIELLVVLAILVAISAIGVQMVSGVDEKADDSLVRT